MLKQPVRAFPILLLVWLLGPVRAQQPPGLEASRSPSVEDLKPSAGAVTRLGRARYLNIGKVFSVAFSPDGTILAAAGWDGSIRLWDVRRGQELRQCSGHAGPELAVAFAPDGKTLVSS